MAYLKKIWEDIRLPVINQLKGYLLTHYTQEIMENYQSKIEMIVRKYSKALPNHVVGSEIDDLRTVSQLEFLETFKVWDSENHADIWPLAQARMMGAMKDHIRYITRSDPSRLYDWITDAAQLYLTVQSNADFETKVENGDQLSRAMEVLTLREKQIVNAHTRADLTFKQIGGQIGVSESQVSRIYKKALEKLKKKLIKDQ
jgi:RNA polymerase sigma factor (sigma-70 family)